MGASFRVKKRLIIFLCQNPHFTCVLYRLLLKMIQSFHVSCVCNCELIFLTFAYDEVPDHGKDLSCYCVPKQIVSK